MEFKVGGNQGTRAAGSTNQLKTQSGPIQPAQASPAATAADTATTSDLRHQYAPDGAGQVAPAIDPGSTDPAIVDPLRNEILELIGEAAGKPAHVKFAGERARWTAGDLQATLDVIQALPPKDRSALANATFKRIDKLPEHTDGRPDYGRIDYHSSDDGGPLTITLSDAAAQSPEILRNVLAHEIGHACQGHGRFEANQVREFAKLSAWTEKGPPESLLDGYADSHHAHNREDAYPKNPANFVSDHAKESAQEDFAESYRAYLLEPATLMQKAPEKFLYLNARSGKYTIAQAQALAADAKVDLPLTMALLRKSNLRPETVSKIAQAHGLIEAGDAAKAARDAIAAIMDKAGDPDFVKALEVNPQAALGSRIWKDLSESERKLLDDDAYIDKLAAAAAANKAAVPDSISAAEVEAWKDVYRKLLQPPNFWTKLKLLFSVKERVKHVNRILHDPAIWSRFSPETRALIDSKQGQDALRKLLGSVGMTDLMSLMWGTLFGPDKKALAHAHRAIDRMGPSEVQMPLEVVKRGKMTGDLARQIVDTTIDMVKTGFWMPLDPWKAFA